MSSPRQFVATDHQDILRMGQFPQPTRPIESNDTNWTGRYPSHGCSGSGNDASSERGSRLDAVEELIVSAISELVGKIPEKIKKQEMKFRPGSRVNDQNQDTTSEGVETDSTPPAAQSRGLSEEDMSEELRLERFKVRTVELGEGAVVADTKDDKKGGKK